MSGPELGDPLLWNRPRWYGQSPFYEVYFLKLNLPATGSGTEHADWRHALWIRYTLTATKGEPPTGEVWAFIFDAQTPECNQGAKGAASPADVRWQAEFPIRIGAIGELTHTGATGTLLVGGQPLQWTLHWEPARSAIGLFPMRWMYGARFPRTKYVSPHWDVRVSGMLRWGDQSWQVRDAPAQQAHIWGTRYAERWVWAHCNTFVDAPDAVFEGLEVQVQLGRWRTPPMRMLYLRTSEIQFFTRRWRTIIQRRGGPSQVWTAEAQLQQSIGRWRFDAIEGNLRLTGELDAEPFQILGACYTDPDGSRRWCHNTKIGRATLQLFRRVGSGWQMVRSLHAQNSCAIEWVEPAPDARIEKWV